MSVDSIEATLAELRELETGGRGEGARTNILDLVVLCDRREDAEEMADVIASLPYGRPSRTIIALALDGPQEPTFDARVICMERRGDDIETRPICSELITLITGEGGAPLPSLVASLLLPDLPVFLLWRARPDFSGLLVELLWPLVNRVIVDSTAQEGTLERVHELVDRRPERVVTDLSWTKITGWRDAVARAFDVPENVRCLELLTRLEIRHAGESEAQARLLAGWVMGRVKKRAETAIIEEHRDDMKSGSLTSVQLYCPAERFGVVRLDEGVGRVEAPNIPSHNLALRVPNLRELIAQELEIFDRDDVFIEALDWIPAAHAAGSA